jgi:hypothetical protein
MVNYSKEFIEKCKQIYPDDKNLHSALERKAWIAQEILGELFRKYKEDFINQILNHNFTTEEMDIKIDNLRIASKLQSESESF